MLKGAFQRHAALVARVRWRVGWVGEPGQNPVPVEDVADSGGGPTGLVVADAKDALARITNPRGGQASIAYKWAILLELIAAAYLVGRDTDEGETWEAFSPVELIRRRDEWQLLDGPGARRGVPLGPAFVDYTYRPSPAFTALPDAALRAALAELEELNLWDGHYMGAVQSRLANNGILVHDKSFELPSPDPTDTDPTPQKMTLGRHIREVGGRAITTSGSADTAMPITVGVDPGMGPNGNRTVRDLFHWFEMPKSIDATTAARIEVLDRRLAGLLPIPLEQLMGLENVNHWNAWAIEEQGYKQWVQPTVGLQTDALTVDVFRPDLIERDHDPAVVAHLVVYGDPTEVIAPPDRTDDLAKAYELGAITAEPYADAIGVDDEDQVAEGFRVEPSAFGGDETSDGGPPDQSEPDEARSLVAGFRRGMAEATSQVVAEAERAVREAVAAAVVPAIPLAAATAAAAPSDGASDLGLRLATIDRETMAVLLVECDRTLRDALRRAGAKLRTQTQANPRAKAKLRDKPPADRVGEILGRSLVAAADIDVDGLFAGSLDTLAGRFETVVAKAQRRALREVEREGTMSGDERASAEAEQAEARALAWPVLAASMARLARERLFDPDPGIPTVGEFDPDRAVPAGVVRQALAIAGGQRDAELTRAGAVTVPSAPGSAPAGPATGPTMQRVVSVTLSMAVVGWVWVHGDADRPFDPHLDLDGFAFSSWGDPELANTEDFPPTDTYRPSDHGGCTCSVSPLMAVPEGEA